MRKYLLLLVLLGISIQVFALDLVENGHSDYVIVIPDQANKQSREAATMLAKTIADMTGVRLAVFEDGKVPPGKPQLAVGNTIAARSAGIETTGLDREEQVIKTHGKNLIITGGEDNGEIFAVYDFLQNQAGCDWFDSLTAHIPRTDRFSIPKLDIRKKPSFLFRRIFTGSGMLRPGYNIEHSLKASSFKVYGSPGDCHTFYAYSTDWPKDNLELFAMNERGKREMPRGRIGVNFCLTNPEGIELVKKKLRSFIAADRAKAKREGYPAPFIYDISQNDSSDYFCFCPNCKAVVEKSGQAGLLLNFINQIANDIKDDFPEIIIATFAYGFTETLQEGITPASNVMVRLTRTQGDYFRPVTEDHSSGFRQMLESWGKVTDQLGVWDYWVFFWDSYPTPYHNVHLLKQNLQSYKSNNVSLIMAESENPETANFYALKYWLGHKLMDDLSQSDTELIDRFMKGYYGAGSDGVKEFYDYLAIRQREEAMKVFGTPRDKADKAYLDRDFYLKCEDVFARAEVVCEPGSIAMMNVRRERIPIDVSMLYRWEKLDLPFDREEIIRRYEEYRLEQIRFRNKESAQGEAIGTLKGELIKLRNSDQIVRQKKAVLRSMRVPQSNDWGQAAVVREWFEYFGIRSERDIALQARHDGGKLYLRFTEKNIDRPLRSTANLWDGDEWEIMLGGARHGVPFMQILVDSAKKMQIVQNIPRPDGSDKVEKYNVPGLIVDSEFKNGIWTLTVEIPFSAIPVKGLAPGGTIYGNFFRSANAAELAQSWNPPFERYFRNRNAFGKIILEK